MQSFSLKVINPPILSALHLVMLGMADSMQTRGRSRWIQCARGH